jgi:predicted deacetylase
MQDYYSLYTWAMDKQAHLEREAARQRLARHSRSATHRNLRFVWPIARRKDERKAA